MIVGTPKTLEGAIASVHTEIIYAVETGLEDVSGS